MSSLKLRLELFFIVKCQKVEIMVHRQGLWEVIRLGQVFREGSMIAYW